MVSSPALLLAPSAYSQNVMGAPAKSACLWINSLGWTTVVPDWSEITAAPMEILHGAWAGVQVKRKLPPMVVPAGEPSAPEKVAQRVTPLPRSTNTLTRPYSGAAGR